MGRGQGGSKSYGKRTPGGISTSSKMSQSNSELAEPIALENYIRPEGAIKKISKNLGVVISDVKAERAMAATKKQFEDNPEALQELESGDIGATTMREYLINLVKEAGYKTEKDAKNKVTELWTRSRTLPDLRRAVNARILDIGQNKEFLYTDDDFARAFNQIVKDNKVFDAVKDAKGKPFKIQDFVDAGVKEDKLPLILPFLEPYLIEALSEARIRAAVSQFNAEQANATKPGSSAPPNRGGRHAVLRHETGGQALTKDADAKKVGIARREYLLSLQDYSNGLELTKKNTQGIDMQAHSVPGSPNDIKYSPEYEAWLEGQRDTVGGFAQDPDYPNDPNRVITTRVNSKLELGQAYTAAAYYGRMLMRTKGIKSGDEVEVVGMPGWYVKNNDGLLEVYADVKMRMESLDGSRDGAMAHHVVDSNGVYLTDHVDVHLSPELEEAFDKGKNVKDGTVLVYKGKRADGARHMVRMQVPMREISARMRVYPYSSLGTKYGIRAEGDSFRRWSDLDEGFDVPL